MLNNSAQSFSFTWPIRVYMPDTDMVGVVYHANYARFADLARTEWLRSCDWPISRFEQELGLYPVVARMEIDYKLPAKVDDLLEIRCSIEKITAARTIMLQNIMRNQTLLANIRIVLVFIDGTGRPKPQPKDFIRLFQT